MQEYVVIKKGASIRDCINVPDDFIDLDLEIKIRPLAKTSKISEKLEAVYKKFSDVAPFKNLEDPNQWQRKIRDEWD
jgi:hypothetical protein